MIHALAIALTLIVSPPAWAGKRSYAAKAEFKRLSPCPTNDKTRGPCPGWEIDHIVPLKCGGADAPANMQWLTFEDHKEKTRREARICLKGASS